MVVDDLLETIETFIADLSESVVDVLLGARSSSTGVIIDDDSETSSMKLCIIRVYRLH